MENVEIANALVERRLAELAITASDIEFILISDAIDGPPVKDLVQWLRKDYRTAGIPIGVMANSDDLYSLRTMFDGDKLTAVFPRIYSAEVAQADVEILRRLAGRNYITREERVEQARVALAAIARLAAANTARATRGAIHTSIRLNVLFVLTTGSEVKGLRASRGSGSRSLFDTHGRLLPGNHNERCSPDMRMRMGCLSQC